MTRYRDGEGITVKENSSVFSIVATSRGMLAVKFAPTKPSTS